MDLGQVVAIQTSNITIGQILMRSFISQWYLLFLFFLFIKPSKALFTNYTHHLAQSSSREHLQLSNNVIPGKPSLTTQTAITLKPGQERIHEHCHPNFEKLRLSKYKYQQRKPHTTGYKGNNIVSICYNCWSTVLVGYMAWKRAHLILLHKKGKSHFIQMSNWQNTDAQNCQCVFFVTLFLASLHIKLLAFLIKPQIHKCLANDKRNGEQIIIFFKKNFCFNFYEDYNFMFG